MTTTMKPSELGLEELLTIDEVAQRLRVCSTSIRRWIAGGVLEAIAMPHAGDVCHWRIKASVIDAMIGEQKGA